MTVPKRRALMSVWLNPSAALRIFSCVATRRVELVLDAPAAHHENAIAHPEQFGQLGGNHDDAGAGFRQAVHQVVDLDLGANVDAARGFVEDEDARIAGKPLAEHDFLLIAAAQ